jgi:hypothetical protein
MPPPLISTPASKTRAQFSLGLLKKEITTISGAILHPREDVYPELADKIDSRHTAPIGATPDLIPYTLHPLFLHLYTNEVYRGFRNEVNSTKAIVSQK